MNPNLRAKRFRLLWMLALGLFACDAPVSDSTPIGDVGASPSTDSIASQTPEVSLSSPLRALTPTEYNNTVRDLLGMPLSPRAWPAAPAIAARLSPTPRERAGLFGSPAVTPAPWPWAFPPEAGVDHFEGLAEGQAPSPYLIEELELAANHFAAFTLVSPTFFSCDWPRVDQTDKEACAWASVERFTQRAWRRSITPTESERLRVFFDEQWAAGTPDEAVVMVTASVLQTPQFLYLIEEGRPDQATAERVPLSDWEIAARLSYFLWDSMPDAALFGAAARGQLSTRADVEAQARRMLESPRAREAIIHFHHQWLGTNRVHHISPARRVYGPTFGIAPAPPLDTTGDGVWPQFMGTLRNSMEAETHLFIERTIFDGAGTLQALLTDNTGYMSDATAPLYGNDTRALDGDLVTWEYGVVVFSMGGTQRITLRPVEFPAEQRAGLLTLPSVLSIGAYTVHPAPILRGQRVLERIACQALGSPPPGAEAAVPPDAEDVDATNRERTHNATSAPVCAACHSVLNPPGFAFESFDAMGGWRTEDNGAPVDTTGHFDLFSGESFVFETAVDLAHQLSTSAQVQDCYSLRWARYATGLQLEESHPGLAEVQAAFRADDTITALLVRIAGTDLFRSLSQGGDR